MDNILFETNTKYTFEEYRKCYWNVRKRLIIMCYGMLCLLISYQCRNDGTILLIMDAIAACIVAVLNWVVIRWMLRREYNSNKSLKDLDTKVLFYDNYLESINEAGLMKIKYDDIYRIIETDTNFYILISRSLVVITVKQNCSAELISFIKTNVMRKK